MKKIWTAILTGLALLLLVAGCASSSGKSENSSEGSPPTSKTAITAETQQIISQFMKKQKHETVKRDNIVVQKYSKKKPYTVKDGKKRTHAWFVTGNIKDKSTGRQFQATINMPNKKDIQLDYLNVSLQTLLDNIKE